MSPGVQALLSAQPVMSNISNLRVTQAGIFILSFVGGGIASVTWPDVGLTGIFIRSLSGDSIRQEPKIVSDGLGKYWFEYFYLGMPKLRLASD